MDLSVCNVACLNENRWAIFFSVFVLNIFADLDFSDSDQQKYSRQALGKINYVYYLIFYSSHYHYHYHYQGIV